MNLINSSWLAQGLIGAHYECAISQLSHNCSLPSLRILLANTQVTRSSKTMVSEVQRRVNASPSVMDPILAAIQAISEQCEVELQQLVEAELRPEGEEDAVQESYRRIGVSVSCCSVCASSTDCCCTPRSREVGLYFPCLTLIH